MQISQSLTLSLEDTIDEVTLVETAVGPLITSSSVFLALVVLTLETDLSLFPCFGAHSMLMVVHPVAFICATFRVYEDTPTVGHAISPFTLINASIRLNHAPEALHLTLDKLALVF